MTILPMLLEFIEKIVNIKIWDIKIIYYMESIATVIIIFKIFHLLSGSKGNKKNKKGSE